MRLRRSKLNRPGYARRRSGRGFTYLDTDGRRLTDPAAVERIKALVIPPAWTDVWICPDPAGHIQATFRCLVRQGNIDPKAPDTLNGRVHTCWINPTAEPQGTAAAPSGTTNR